MVEPISIMLIVSIVGTGLTFLLNVYQSIRSRHFSSSCMGCDVEYDSEHQDNKKKECKHDE